MTYHSGGHTELQKFPAMSQSCMWNPQSPSLPIFLPAGYAKVHGQLILRLLYAFHICLLVSWFCSFTLIPYVIITSYTLLLCDSTFFCLFVYNIFCIYECMDTINSTSANVPCTQKTGTNYDYFNDKVHMTTTIKGWSRAEASSYSWCLQSR